MPPSQRRRQLPDVTEIGLRSGQGSTDSNQCIVPDDPKWSLVFFFSDVFAPTIQLAQRGEAPRWKCLCSFDSEISVFVHSRREAGPAQ